MKYSDCLSILVEKKYSLNRPVKMLQNLSKMLDIQLMPESLLKIIWLDSYLKYFAIFSGMLIFI